MLASSRARSGLTGARSITYAMFRAYELRVIMFGPHASPVVQLQRTWHIGPTTCVSTSRSLAWREMDGLSSPAIQARIDSASDSTHWASATASWTCLQTKQDALVILSFRTYVL